MSNNKSSAGNRSDKIRSDCYIELALRNSGGLKIDLKSKVESMYGESIRELIIDMCRFFNIKNAKIKIEDYGALPFTITARIETAIKRISPGIKKEYLLPINKKSQYKSAKQRFRRSRLYLPGNEPKYLINAGLHEPDCIILDLEDSVAANEKDSAQLLVRNALRSVNFYGSEKMVRINQLPEGLNDLKYIVLQNVHVILIPKCEGANEVKRVDKEITRIKKTKNINTEIFLIPIIESALGVINAYEIASASKNNCGLAIGLEDYTADIETQRTEEGKESFYARSVVVNTARAAGIQPIDTVYSDVKDMKGLRESALEAKSLGFEGKGCIHPRQIEVVHKAFAPTEKEIEQAKKIVLAFEEAKKKGLGVVSIGSKMIDAPVVKRAQKTIELAILNKLVSKNFR
jgi:citrate lyase subunit beta / citryl-CoA lyase